MKHSSIEHLLEDDHAKLGELLARLCSSLDRPDAEQSFAQLDLFWARLAVHIRAEHLCLFPAVLSAACQDLTAEGGAQYLAEVQGMLNELRHDHDFFMNELARAVNTMREMRAADDSGMKEERLSGVRQIIKAIGERLDRHNKLEEEQVYRWPLALLDKAAQAQLGERVRRELERMPPRFTESSEAGNRH
jgi:hypothetical protein